MIKDFARLVHGRDPLDIRALSASMLQRVGLMGQSGISS